MTGQSLLDAIGTHLRQPGAMLMATVSAVTRELNRTRTAQRWVSANVFVPDTDKRVALTAFERTLLRELPYLVGVCHRPLDRLGVERDVVAAARARRVPAEGLVRLAGHREDWYGIAHGRIHPRRLISLTYVEDLDFYENRVAAQLVDRLRGYLADRLADLRDLDRHLADLDRYGQALRDQQSVWKLRRLSLQLAGAAAAAADAAVHTDTARRLREAHSTVLALRGSPAYRAADRRGRLPIRLRRTNLLNNNDRYHHVATLWDAWARSEVASRQAAGEAASEFGNDYATYIAALVLRACASLNLVPVAADAPAPGADSRVELAGSAARYALTTADGVVQLWHDGRSIGRVVPFGHALTRAENTAKIRQDLRSIRAAAMAWRVPTIVAYPGLRAERDRLPPPLDRLVHASGTLTAFGAPRALVALIPVTPLEIEGIERMARALRWIVHAQPMLERYPPQARLPLARTSADWLASSGRTWELLRRPTAAERAALLDEVRRHAVSRFGTGRPAGGGADPVREAVAALDTATAVFDLVQSCPVCPNAAPAFESRHGGTFHCRCSNCSTQWGTRQCRCGEKFPVLWPKGARYTGDDGGQLDAAFGQDLLALPCTTSPDGSRFRCPWCARCQGAPSCGCPPSEPDSEFR